MPWVKRLHRSTIFYWIIGGLALVAVATVVGYELGNSKSVVTVVEQHLATSDAQVRRLEKRIETLETKLGIVPVEVRAKSD